jgi:hypothetical protein
MAFGLSAAAVAGIAVAGATVVSGVLSADASKNAADTQAAASETGIQEQRRQFEAIQKLLAPFTQGGTAAFGQQQALIGVQGPEAQQQAINALEQGPAFQSIAQQGENAILQNASATGGLRGGNVQAALGQFRPQLLSQLIDQQFNQLGGLSATGQASAAGQATAAQNQGSAISNLLAQQGAAVAGGQLAAGRAAASIPAAISSGFGMFKGLGGKF